MRGMIPAAGSGTRIQPLAFSKELLPVGSRIEGGIERPRAVSEYLVERMLAAGRDKICFVIAPGKSDILEYYGGSVDGVPICYVVQGRPAGLCDAIFCALPHATAGRTIVVGLPDTVWFPGTGCGGCRTTPSRSCCSPSSTRSCSTPSSPTAPGGSRRSR